MEFACFAVSNVDVGIDIEKIIPFENLEEVSKRIIPRSIYLEIMDQNERLNAFYKWWTRIEAILKVKGTGFFHKPKDITSDHFQDNKIFELKSLKLLDVASPINYSAAVCLSCNWDTTLLRNWKPFSNFSEISSTEQVLNSYDVTEEQVNFEKCYWDDTIQLEMLPMISPLQ